jgi:hypothetical protein
MTFFEEKKLTILGTYMYLAFMKCRGSIVELPDTCCIEYMLYECMSGVQMSVRGPISELSKSDHSCFSF